MTFEIKFEGWMQPYEYRAFALMFTALANGKEADKAERKISDPDTGCVEAPPTIRDNVFANSTAGFVQVPVTDPDGNPPSNEAPPVTLTNTPRAGESAAQTAGRERGKPSPGRARRTKEEIAEDEAAEKAAPVTGQSISTGGERVGETDDAETAAQDAADEAAEAGPAPSGPITIQDLKDIAGAYIQLHGMPAVQEDGHKILGAALGTPPEGEIGWRMSIIPEDKYETAYTAFKAAVDAGKRFGT